MGDDQSAPSELLALRQEGVVEVPTWFGPDDRPLFGWFTVPTDGRVRGAVILCQPMGEEGDKTYRTFRRLSQRLARAGLLAFRFDYDGTGDSAGGFDDPRRAESWISSVEYAAAEVRRVGVGDISLIGMRLGGTIAYAAAARGLRLNHLVLWDPCASGRAFLREQQMLHASWLDVDEADPLRWIETPSYRYPLDAGNEMRSLAVDGRASASALADRVTVLVRPDRPAARSLVESLSGSTVVWGETIGQDLLLDHRTSDARVPDEGIADIVARFSASADAAWFTPRLMQTVSASWSEAGREISETAVLTGTNGQLFGIQSRGVDYDSSLPGLLMLNVAVERHIGSGRIWVRLARELAGQGFVSLRLDQSGAGDSATPPGGRDDELLAERWMEDVPAVAEKFPSPAGVVGIGLCSSGVSVLQSSASGVLREAICVNVPLRVTQSSYVTTMSRKWTAFSHMPAPLNRLSIRHARTARMLWAAWSLVSPRSSPLWTARQIVRGGGRVTFLVGPGDREHVTETRAWWALWGRPLERTPGFRVLVRPSADHSLRAARGQDEVVEALDQHLRAYRSEVRD
ncbi:hypothetical protein [Humibacter sp.]|uniref:hypothetical protein n=1 Tax=Humibacter sp. TaxID=1940291 RepID=UPI003F816DF5